MANVYKPGLLQIRPQYSHNPDAPDTPENILWFQSGSTTTPDLAQLISIQTAFDNNWSAAWINWGAETAEYYGSIITDWSSNTGLSNNSVGTFTPQEGVAGTTVCPPQVALLVSWHVPIRYRGGHPRTYLPYLASNCLTGATQDQVKSAVTESVVGGINDMITAMKATGILGGQTQSVYLHKNNEALATVMPFSSFTVQGTVATQRRRVRKAAHK